MTSTETPTTADDHAVDNLSIGRRIRFFRKQADLTLADLGERVGRAASQISTIENGKRETSVTLLASIAEALGTEVAELIDPTPVDGRQALEIEAERNQASPMYSSLGLPQVRTKSLPQDALEAIVGLQRQLAEVLTRRAATPEEARRANRELRETMREKNNYFADLEKQAAELLRLADYESGTVSQRETATIAEKLGFSLHYVSDLPSSTRSISDTANRRIYLPNADAAFDPRTHLLTSLAPHVLGHGAPKDFGEFLRQRVDANYLAAAVLLPESSAVPVLTEAKRRRALSIENLRDMFGVGYETAAHRFTNLATEHLGLPVHFMKVHASGTIHKAYSNDGLPFPTDPLGAIEGQFACKRFTSRTVFRVADRFSPYYQYTDTPEGSYWCTARVLPGGDYAISVGVPFAHVKWFEGRESSIRSQSRCPDLSCCRTAPPDLAAKWEDHSLPSAKMHASLLAAVPPGAVPGVDETEVYAFLERHSG